MVLETLKHIEKFTWGGSSSWGNLLNVNISGGVPSELSCFVKCYEASEWFNSFRTAKVISTIVLLSLVNAETDSALSKYLTYLRSHDISLTSYSSSRGRLFLPDSPSTLRTKSPNRFLFRFFRPCFASSTWSSPEQPTNFPRPSRCYLKPRLTNRAIRSL